MTNMTRIRERVEQGGCKRRSRSSGTERPWGNGDFHAKLVALFCLSRQTPAFTDPLSFDHLVKTSDLRVPSGTPSCSLLRSERSVSFTAGKSQSLRSLGYFQE